MNNKKFSNYVTSSAFHLSLSKNMINMLLWLNEQSNGQWYIWLVDGHTGRALKARGLVNENSFITDEGRLVAHLLTLAGYSKFEPKPIASTHQDDIGAIPK